MKPTLFLDMDGVLADFDKHHENVFGWRPDRSRPAEVYPDVDWNEIGKRKDYYLNIPPMEDAFQLRDFAFAACHSGLVGDVAILTGIPRHESVPEAAMNKLSWIRKYISPSVEVLTCPSRDKSFFCDPGDILVDDWVRYRHLWEAKEGIFILHTSAEDSIERLRSILC